MVNIQPTKTPRFEHFQKGLEINFIFASQIRGFFARQARAAHYNSVRTRRSQTSGGTSPIPAQQLPYNLIKTRGYFSTRENSPVEAFTATRNGAVARSLPYITCQRSSFVWRSQSSI